MDFRAQSRIVYAIWATLGVAIIWALIDGRWPVAFVAAVTLVVSCLPALAVERLDIKLPVSFMVAIVAFTFATIFLGEAFDFYGRYWWWDLVLHFSSAIGFGLLGFLLVFMLFEGDRYAAPPWAIAFLSLCVAVTIGAVWEIFEFTMDRSFRLNMQKSGLLDTMGDLIMDLVGGALAAFAGFVYLKGKAPGGVRALFDDFIRLNSGFYAKYRSRVRRGRRK
ncbi:hypothetical protein DDZ14_18400 [Maritimibacter sp. 55A14]|uniref:hypothetical protein n=1 Tax=Maritimibacter sp. 55A14 TaxID=2174844 RepID=UPI000D61F611|nr:hypothetical protein [Maritimibacter sp. 55A14]PWE28846.1 hypothetical protein DDZ14_18400 [Maritimibacter sp. 55A14]